MSCIRKLKRTRLKRMLGNNNICQEYHERYDTLEQKIRRSNKNGDNRKELF